MRGGRQVIIENASIDTIADQLKNGYWWGEPRHFDVTQGGTITVNLSFLNADEKFLARTALNFWTDVTGITFAGGKAGSAQIQFYNSEGSDGPVASTSNTTAAGGLISSSYVTISSSWVNNYGIGLDSYSLQTYIHEIGHAIGLGHAGNYNMTADFETESLFSNDSWSTSIMSYFDQEESTYFNALDFSPLFALTPMQADIVAIQGMYGLSTTTRTTDTTYGYHSNAGTIFDAAAYPMAVYTVFDSGGTDTIDYSGSSATQRINLNAETFSNVNGYIGNLAIARTVVIENAVGGSGADTLIGNAVANVLTGNDGDDMLDGGAGADTLTGGAGNDRIVFDAADNAAQVTGGAGFDTLVINDLAAPTAYNLAAGGFEAAERVQHDSGGADWTTLTSIYNQAWQMTAQDVRYDNGTRAWSNFDVSNSENWTQVWFNYDLQDRIVTADLFRDDGAHSWSQYDVDNQQNWNELIYVFDTQGRVASHDIRYDDGTRGWSNLDLDNTQSWSQSWVTYDAQSRLISQETRNDDGTRVWGTIDVTNAQTWSDAWYGFDTQNRMTSLEVHFDDGRRNWTGYDAANTQSWADQSSHYDASGHLFEMVTTWDDGTTTTKLF